MTARRRAWAAALATIVVTAGLADAQTTDPDALRWAASRALTTAPAVDFGQPGGAFASGGAARRAAEERADAVPLPRGGNFNGVRWEEAGPGLSEADVDAVQDYNAACQWLRALSDGRQAVLARAILADVSAWPAFRGNERGKTWAQVLAAPGGDLAQTVLADCRASHDREAKYAAAQGLPPST
jgi:hypothetical protein